MQVGDAEVVLLDESMTDITDDVPGSGTAVAHILLVDPASGEERQKFARNEWGTFFQVFQPNRWHQKRRQLAQGTAARETVMQ